MQKKGASFKVDEFMLEEWNGEGLYVADVEGVLSWWGVAKLLLINVLQKFKVGELRKGFKVRPRIKIRPIVMTANITGFIM